MYNICIIRLRPRIRQLLQGVTANMFGFRPDGRRIVKGIDPIVLFTPYIMPTRNDAQVYINTQMDYEAMSAYIRKNKSAQYPISFMTIIIAAFVQAVNKYPELNRFIANKQLYQRNELTISFMVVRQTENGDLDEAAVKLHCELTDTIWDVARKIDEAVKVARKPTAANKVVDFARMALSLPLLPNVIVGLARLLDRYGILPRAIIDISPFHCSLFVTNMASLGMPAVFHHLYNFGTTSIFLSLGKPERSNKPGLNGSGSKRNIVPCGVVIDERCCGGAAYARGFQYLQSLINNPELLERPYGAEPAEKDDTTSA